MDQKIKNIPFFDFNLFRRSYKTDGINIPEQFQETKKEDFIKEFKSDKNIDDLSRIILQKLDLYDSKLLPIIKIDVIKFIDSWINLGKFDALVQSSSLTNQLFLYNKKFADVFEYEFKKKYNVKNDTNPFFEVINGKKREEFRPEDYASLNVQQFRTNHLKESLDKSRNTIKFYEKAIYKRHYDTIDDDKITTHGNDRHALIYTDERRFDKGLAEIDDRTSNSNNTLEKESLKYNRFFKKDLDILTK